MPSTDSSTARSAERSIMTIPFQMRNAVLTNRSGSLRYLAFTSCHRNSTSGAGQPFAMADNVLLGSRAWSRSGLSEYASRALREARTMPQQGLRAGPGGRTRRRPAEHGAPWARGHPGAGPGGRRNQRVSEGGHRPLASFITLWPASCCRTGSGPHGCCARPSRFRRRGGSRMGRHGAVGEEPGPVGRHDGPAPAPAARSCPRAWPGAWPGTAWIGELTATGRPSSGQAGQPPALSGQTAFFRVLERIPAGSEGLRVAGTRSVPDRWPAGWSEAGDGAVLVCIYRCIGRGEGSRAIDKNRANEA